MSIINKYIENEKNKLQTNINIWNDSLLSIRNNNINNFTEEQKEKAIKSIENNISILQNEINEIEFYKKSILIRNNIEEKNVENIELLLKMIIINNNKIIELIFYNKISIISIIIIFYYYLIFKYFN